MPASQCGLNCVGIPNQLIQCSRMAGGSSRGQSTFNGRGRIGGRTLGSGIRSTAVRASWARSSATCSRHRRLWHGPIPARVSRLIWSWLTGPSRSRVWRLRSPAFGASHLRYRGGFTSTSSRLVTSSHWQTLTSQPPAWISDRNHACQWPWTSPARGRRRPRPARRVSASGPLIAPRDCAAASPASRPCPRASSGVASMPSSTPAQSPAAKTVGTLVRIDASVSGTQPPSADVNPSRAPIMAGSSTLGTSPMARHTVSHATSRSLPATGLSSASTRTRTTDSTSPTRPRASRIV